MAFHDVGPSDQVREGEMIRCEVAGRRILVARVGGKLHAIGAVCTHEEGYLDEGELEGYHVFCPIHFAGFDVRTGQVVAPPAEEPEPVFAVREEGGRILVSDEPERT